MSQEELRVRSLQSVRLVRSRAWRDLERSGIIGAMIENIGTMKLSDGEGEAIAIDYVLQSGGFYRLIIKHKNDVVFDVEEVNLGFPPECPGTADGRHEWPDSSKNTTVSCRACGKIRR